jgi:hypothetical protein
MALITVAEAKASIRAVRGSDEDAAIALVIAAMEATIARHCGYPPATAGAVATMESASYTRYYDAERIAWRRDRRLLPLGIWPVTAVASVHDDPTDEAYGSSTLIDSGDYTVTAEGPRLKPTSSWSWSSSGERAFKVAFTAGYATAPADLKAAIITAVADAWESQRKPLPGTRVDPMRVGLRSEVIRALHPYMLPPALGVGYLGAL